VTVKKNIRFSSAYRARENLLGMNARIIRMRPSRNPRWQKQGGWECDEGDSVSCVHCGPRAREDALSYAQQRAGYDPCQIQVLDEAWNIVETINNENAKPLV
jgi:hypothetical protein